MKTHTLISAIGLVIGFSTGLPNPSPTSTTTIVNTITVIPGAAASPYPAKPTTNEFKYLNFGESTEIDKEHRTEIHTAFEDWASVIQKAIESLGNPQDNTYQTWFPDTVKKNKKPVREFPAGVFKQLLDSSANPPAPLPYVASFVCDNVDFAGLNNEGLCGGDDAATSYFRRQPTEKFHICPFGFIQPIKATAIACSKVGDAVSYDMQSLTGTLVHEFMHSRNTGAATPEGKIRVDLMYGPSNCMRFAKGRQSDRTFYNADSYKWFALNAFYNSYCGTTFEIPLVTQADFDRGMAELKSSPSYNATLSDGLLAGV